jgi:Type II secretion system protein C
MRWRVHPSILSPAVLVNLVAAGMIASVVVAAGRLGWSLIGYSGTAPAELPPVAIAAPRPSFATSFHPFGVEAPGDAIPATSLPIQLRGIVYSASQRLAVAYLGPDNAMPHAVRVGEDAGGGMILEIQRDRVLLRVGDRTESLSLLIASGVTRGKRISLPAVPDPVPAGRPRSRSGTLGLPTQMLR